MTPPALSLSDVSLTYDSGHKALYDVSARFEAGSFTALVGPSGCGKSSLLRLLARLLVADKGQLETVAQNDIGFVFQEPALLAWRSVYENTALPMRIAGLERDEIAARTDAALALVGLSGRADALPHELSGGMKMRVSLARALVKRPPVLLMDEPFAALDELTRFRLDDDLRAIWQQQKCTVIFVTHSITEAAYLAERALVMETGRIKTEIAIKQKTRTADFRTAPEFHAACAAINAALDDSEAV